MLERMTKITENHVEVEQIHGCKLCDILVLKTETYGQPRIDAEKIELGAYLVILQSPNYLSGRIMEVNNSMKRLNEIEGVLCSPIGTTQEK